MYVLCSVRVARYKVVLLDGEWRHRVAQAMQLAMGEGIFQ